ncbi:MULTISPECIES: hypothetical protein [Bacillus]|uniref:Uncharacterized protein n=1 Tax=Bacillus mycoides TaxID=1405 RepID=C2Y2Y0_BACMY|nr:MULTISPECIES: hypothetical protein [Bacillus]EEL67742.1 hypothetical protein bcere0026_53270 [Bacillus mycoides]RBP25789.1 hypothetical protein DET63_10962 [Bacillus sp. DB-2]REF29059.1 hypothetical protein DET55_12183 [Bacillus mycoides]
MGREVLFDNQSVILKLSGVTGFFALKLKLEIPYNTIKNVYVQGQKYLNFDVFVEAKNYKLNV